MADNNAPISQRRSILSVYEEMKILQRNQVNERNQSNNNNDEEKQEHAFVIMQHFKIRGKAFNEDQGTPNGRNGKQGSDQPVNDGPYIDGFCYEPPGSAYHLHGLY